MQVRPFLSLLGLFDRHNLRLQEALYVALRSHPQLNIMHAQSRSLAIAELGVIVYDLFDWGLSRVQPQLDQVFRVFNSLQFVLCVVCPFRRHLNDRL
jgi:hypothetical protein